jgi:class 3 adenylate cyclase
MQARMGELFAGALELRVGVNTGEVVVGGAGEGSFATGDTMNVAARLGQAACPRQVLAGERTAAAAAEAFLFGDAMVVEAKGKPDGVACRPVLGVASPVARRGIGTPHVFVGRHADLKVLRDAYTTPAAVHRSSSSLS